MLAKEVSLRSVLVIVISFICSSLAWAEDTSIYGQNIIAQPSDFHIVPAEELRKEENTSNYVAGVLAGGELAKKVILQKETGQPIPSPDKIRVESIPSGQNSAR